MRLVPESGAFESLSELCCLDTPMLSPRQERESLTELVALRNGLIESLLRGDELASGEEIDDPAAASRRLAVEMTRRAGTPGPQAADLQRYFRLRTDLALANMRLVAHVAKRYRDRGIAYSDLLQEGVCGLLEAIDRFDLSHETRLSTYATWWIRQSVQRALAAGAYPVRLSPRHLRELAQLQEAHDRVVAAGGVPDAPSSESIQRIQAATRPAVSLSAPTAHASIDSLPLAGISPEGAGIEEADLEEFVKTLMQSLRPREREVLLLRFGLGDRPRLSLSQVGRILDVSKERVRQIQDRALTLLRSIVSQDNPLGIY